MTTHIAIQNKSATMNVINLLFTCLAEHNIFPDLGNIKLIHKRAFPGKINIDLSIS